MKRFITLLPLFFLVIISNAQSDSKNHFLNHPPSASQLGCDELLIEAGITEMTCYGSCDGIISIVQIVNGVAPFTYEWSNGDTDETAEALCAGIYTVTVTDAESCVVNGTWTIAELPVYVADATSTDETIMGANDGTASVVVIGGFSPYSYLWSNGGTTEQITGLAPGIYSVIVTDSINCAANDTVTVEAGPCAQLTGTVTNVTCNGICDGSISLNGIWTSVIWSNDSTTFSIQDLCAGDYSVTATDASGCTGEATFTVSEPDPLIANTESTDETVLGDDGTASVVPDGGTEPYTYLWSNGDTTQTIENLSPGIYSVTVTDSAGCSDVAEVVVNPFGCPDLLIEAAVTDISCFGSCDGIISIVQIVNGAAPFNYDWSQGDSDETADALCAGTYTVTVTDADNCIVLGDWTIAEPSALVANATSTDETIIGADDGTASVVVSGGTPSYSYLWSNGGTTEQITGLAPGIYSVIVTDDNNCEAYDTVTVEAGPCPVLGGAVTDVSCFGLCDGSIDIDNGWAFYAWSNGSSSGDLDALCAGTYSVTVSDGMSCTGEAVFTVSQPDLLIANTGSTEESDPGDNGTAWVVPAGGTPPYTYLWSNGSTDSLITGLNADIYTVILTDANGCADTADVEVTEFSCFIISENEVQHVFCHDSCEGLIFVVPIGGVGPFEYDWSIGDTTNVVFDLCAGWYSVTVTDLGQDGCSSFIDVQILQPDTFYIDIDTVVHVSDTSNGSIDVTFHGGTLPYHPQWLGPNGFVTFDEDIEDLIPGTYVLNLFDNNDCSISDTIEILDLMTGLPVLPEDAVSIYPNPASSDIHIDTKLTGDYSVELYSMLGIHAGTWQNVRTIDVRGFAAGMYVVRINAEEGYYVRRIVVGR